MHLPVPPKEWNYLCRTAVKSVMDSELKVSRRNKLKPKPTTKTVKIRRKIMKQIDLTGKYSPMPDLEKATMEALVEWYNKHSGSTKLLKFSNREIAAKRCRDLRNAMDELAARSTSPSKKQTSKSEETDMSKKSKTAKGKAAKTSKKAATKGKGGTKFALLDHTLHKLVDKNPRREGTHGFKSWQAIKSGMTYRAAIDAGARNKDIRHDVNSKRLELRAPKAKAAKPAKKVKAKTESTPVAQAA